MQETRNILIATSHFVLKMDLETEKIEVVHEGRGLYYGITGDDEQYYVAARWNIPWVLPSKIQRPRILVFDRALQLKETWEFPLKAGGLHQILELDGRLYCSCSQDDRYLIREDGEWSAWYPSPNPRHHDRDTHHFNSIWIDGDRLFIVAHNKGPSDVWEFTYPQRELVSKHRVAECAHNVWKEDGVLAVCNSGGARIETVEGRVLCETGGFPRGALIGPDVNVIGISKRARDAVRWKMKGKIQLYTKDWQLRKEIALGRCGQVHEIRSLGPDLAHKQLPPPAGFLHREGDRSC